ncbi:MAG: MBOAT family protein [Lachnospiraceae bacterium]|nr:MBOAT family protein [Lachnospiraceae bacterium]
MTFLTVAFFILFVITLGLMLLFRGQTARQFILLAASYVFYAYWDVRFLFLLIFQALVVYTGSLLVEKFRFGKPGLAKAAMGILVGIILGLLGFFKYFRFFTESISAITGENAFSALHIILPVGISFYTFQSISYVVDVYRQKTEARKSFLKVSLYISFFPQLMSGPVVRSTHFLPQLDTNPAITWANFEKGCQIFLMGAVKKVVIADRLSVCVNAIYDAPAAYSGASILGAVIAYSLQIYCDFSGYSDMAIGVARVLGYDLGRNFNLPYLSRNLTEFWKRWHISLSAWLQEYLYISLGGNRKGKMRTYVNLMLTMILGGLWHGASWNFVIWGALHGAALVVHKLFLTYKKPKTTTTGVKTLLSIVGTYAFVSFCWIFFRADSFETAWLIISRMFTWADGISYTYVYTVLFALALLLIHIYCYFKTNKEGTYIHLDWNKFLPKVLFILAILLTAAFAYQGNQAFIYFQF